MDFHVMLKYDATESLNSTEKKKEIIWIVTLHKLQNKITIW